MGLMGKRTHTLIGDRRWDVKKHNMGNFCGSLDWLTNSHAFFFISILFMKTGQQANA
jgi:hypothetical protein